jgi:2-methylcitrate dehydratase PrpD
MSKSFHAGKAASNGLLAALLAEQDFDGSEEILEGRRGFCRIYSARTDEEALVGELGSRWEINRNGHKPYACGVVLHPAIDAAIELGRQGPPAGEVSLLEVRVNPAAVSITGVVAPESGLKSKFSLTHTAAVAYLDFAAGVEQFTNQRAGSDDVTSLSKRVTVITDDGLARDQAEATVVGRNGSRVTHRVEHASGTVGNPMSDDALAEKFLANACPVIGEKRADDLMATILRLPALADVAILARLAR